MTRVLALVFPAILSITMAFAVPPSKNVTAPKPAVASTPQTKLATLPHTVAHRGVVMTARASANTGSSLRKVSTRPAYSRTAHGGMTSGTTLRGRRMLARSVAPSFQTRPDEGRYREIQQALAEKGYFKGEVNGQWGSDSVDALQKFQLDNRLPDIYTDGKINSLSLIQLGLGPKHGARTADPVPTPPLPEVPSTLTPTGTSSSASSPPPAPSN